MSIRTELINLTAVRCPEVNGPALTPETLEAELRGTERAIAYAISQAEWERRSFLEGYKLGLLYSLKKLKPDARQCNGERVLPDNETQESPAKMKTNSRPPKRMIEAKTSRTAQRKGDSRAASCSAWAAIWRSKNKLDGHRKHMIFGDNLLLAIFRTRHLAQNFIEAKYGYIRNRADLQAEPHGWRIPKVIKVTITPNAALSESGGDKPKI